MKVAASDLVGKWVHSHEEDEGDERVFRPASFAFPPSRGRRSLDLRRDGSAVDGQIGADDRADARDARWEIRPGNTLHIASGGKTQNLRIVQASPDKLVVADV